ncbi:MAG TPA: hypothetical protein VIM79_07125 [Niastella sp.]
MAHFIVTVRESKAGARRRRKLVVTANSIPGALIAIQDLCRGTGFTPDYSTVNKITSDRYLKTMTTLLGRNIHRPAA